MKRHKTNEEKFSVAHRMAKAIIEIAKVQGGISESTDLLAKGFTQEEIKKYAAMAKALSQVTVNLKKLADA